MTNVRRAAWMLVACSLAIVAGCRSSSSSGDGVGRTAAPPLADVEDRSDRVDASTAPSPSPGRTPAEAAPPSRVVELDGIRVHVDDGIVELDARTCLDLGYLEQIACSPGTREHESLVVVPARPSDVHAALLLAGFENGHPGGWAYEQGEYSFIAPEGDEIDVLVRFETAGGGVRTEPVGRWIRDHRDRMPFPERPWVFGGSVIKPNPEAMGPGEHYVADMTGSLVGLVTFGDEVIGYSEVIADEATVAEPQWVVDAEHVPPYGTDVVLVLRRWTTGAASGAERRSSDH